MLKLLVPHRLSMLGVGATLAAFALLLGWAAAPHAAEAQEAGAAMSIAIDGSGVDCDGDECIVDPGTDFTLTASVTGAPEAGYIGIQTLIEYQNLTYTRTEMATQEILISADSFPGIAVRSQEGEASNVSHGMTAGTPPFSVSQFTGPVVQIALTCTDDYTRNDVALAPYVDGVVTLGTSFKLPAEVGGQIVPAGDELLVHCGPPPTATPPPPGSDDATATPGPGLPTTGTGSEGSSNPAMVFALVAALAAVALSSVGVLSWKRARR